MSEPAHRAELIRILQAAYSGELAAAFAYRGHWKSVTDPLERQAISNIENDEWIHRERIRYMLEHLGSRTVMVKEARMWLIGRTVGLLCHVTGWFLPMYFAGRLEGRNVEEYNVAARHAAAVGLDEFARELRVMAAVEKEHEEFFAGAIAGHRLLPLTRLIFRWGPAESQSTPAATIPPDESYQPSLIESD